MTSSPETSGGAPPAAPRSLTLEAGGTRLEALVWGDPGGRPALALHGWLDNAGSFSRLAPRLPGLQLVALDLPGHGRSAHRAADASYHFIDAVATVAHAIDALGWERCTLIGHSMGAGIASLLAGTWPERFEAVVLLEGLGPLSEAAETAPRRLASALADERRRELRAASGRGNKRVFATRDAAYERMSDVQRVSVDSAIRLCERGLVEVEGGYQWSADPRLRCPSRLRLSEAQVLAFLEGIAAPCLLVRAKDGWPVDPEIMARRRDAVPRLELLEVAGGHHVHLDAPERVAAPIAAFLASTAEREA